MWTSDEEKNSSPRKRGAHTHEAFSPEAAATYAHVAQNGTDTIFNI